MHYQSILDTIGNTPCVQLKKLAPAGVNLFAKLESFNPMASIKDRIALGIIETAEESGVLKPGQTVVEATSGNAGIGLAMVCAQKGYSLVVVMPENFSVERRKLIRFFGAKVVLTPAGYKGSGALAKAQELATRHGWFYCKQFENEANATTHARTTAQEILRDFENQPLHYWVTGYGSGGTLKGVSRVLRLHSPITQIIVCEPNNSQLLAHRELTARAPQGLHASNPQFQPHIMQGWTPDFISRLTDDAYKNGCVDRLIAIDGRNAIDWCRKLAQQEGILTGISGGATLAGAMKIAEAAEPGSNILCLLPDTGERYLTTPLFDHIDTEMDLEEVELSNSTTNFRFAAAPTPLPVMEVVEAEPLIDEISVHMFEQFIRNPKQPVVMFALEWCEFCWSARKLFQQLSIPLHSIDLDSTAYQVSGLGDKMKATLVANTGCSTLPQIFINGEFIGSCMELFDSVNNGALFKKLDQASVRYSRDSELDPYTLLPGWLKSQPA